MANAIIPAAEVAATNQVTAPAATILTAPATEQKEPQPFDYAPDVAGNDAGAARFRCPTEKG